MTTEISGQVIFRYSIITRLFTMLFNTLAFLAPVYIVGSFAIRYYAKYASLSLAAVLPILFYSLFLSVVLLITANYYSEIIADKDGLQVQFLWFRLPLLWQDIVEVKPSIFNLPNRTTTWVVQTRKLSHFIGSTVCCTH